jgi:hypothetical protein
MGAPVLTCVKKGVPEIFMDCHMMVADPIKVRSAWSFVGEGKGIGDAEAVAVMRRAAGDARRNRDERSCASRGGIPAEMRIGGEDDVNRCSARIRGLPYHAGTRTARALYRA